LHVSPVTLHLVYSSYLCLPSTEPHVVDVYRRLVDETCFDPELFWENYDWKLYDEPSSVFKGELQQIVPLFAVEDYNTPLLERIEHMAWNRQLYTSPRDIAHFLESESLEAAYAKSEDNRKRYLLRLALNQWGCNVGDGRRSTASEIWEEALQRLFAVGARFGVLCRQDSAENPEHEVMIEVIRHFVRPYAWENAARRGYPLEARDFLKGFQFLISRLKHLGIKLGKISSGTRLEIRCGEDFIWDHHRLDSWIPHPLSLYYDDGLSTWVVWDSAYEEYCGEFWDLLEHPERTIPGTWID
jgi:hypothetical protein